MTRRDIERYRAATLRAVNAFFDGLAEDAATKRVVVRSPAKPDGEYDALAIREAEKIAARYGVGR